MFVYATSILAVNHITFEGIELNGSFKSFKDSLKSRGFRYVDSFHSMYNFRGKFKNETVSLSVLASMTTNEVCKVIMYFHKHTDWYSLRAEYADKVKMYSEEYPIDKDYEFFEFPYDDGDGYEMKAVAKDKCRYVSFFLAKGGRITVEIDKSARIKVVYEDRENIKIAREELRSCFEIIEKND